MNLLTEIEYQKIIYPLKKRKTNIEKLISEYERQLRVIDENHPKLSKLMDLRNKGIISDEEYDLKFKKLTFDLKAKSKKPTSVDDIEKEIFGE